MGEVLLAHDTQLNRRVALKLLRLDVSLGPAQLERFVQEARAARQPHAGLVRRQGARDLCAHGPLEGIGTLRHPIVAGKPLPTDLTGSQLPAVGTYTPAGQTQTRPPQ